MEGGKDGQGAVDVKDDAGAEVDGVYAADASVAPEGCAYRGKVSHAPVEMVEVASHAWSERPGQLYPVPAEALVVAYQARKECPQRWELPPSAALPEPSVLFPVAGPRYQV